jgi:hypothetical protein
VPPKKRGRVVKKASATPFEIIPPDDTPEFMWPAYFSCLLWALEFEPILNSFTSDTETKIPAPRSEIEKLVDNATGFNPYKEFVRAEFAVVQREYLGLC